MRVGEIFPGKYKNDPLELALNVLNVEEDTVKLKVVVVISAYIIPP